MGIETTLPHRRENKALHPSPEETNSISKPRKSRRRHRKMSPVQKLYETCKVVFSYCGAGIVPSSEDIQKLCSVVDAMRPVDVGLTPELPYFRLTTAWRTPLITYLHLFEGDKFSMGIFCLPPSGVIPLHNHPGMTVFSKLLFGTMHIKSYDWVVDAPEKTSTTENQQLTIENQQPATENQNPAIENQQPTADNSIPPQVNAVAPPGTRLAKMKVDADFTAPCDTSILYPADGGNLHCFTAVTACAVLDVLGPPYSDPDGRHCQYYLDFPFSQFTVDGVSIPEEEKEGYAWLQEIEKPDDLAFVGALYSGPKIQEK
ncbi:PREDICTED: 2-aminoethanethiol dioxygenase-like [Fragaria vesca subsp. vesca]|uniref:2-aminoethanethiol dioxygenase-like n=1 Tax=Fragaria vesca subsp. vesca TaxID=101020 RepID=UPI0002C3688E|nr:PREDICTED: 2-aminoethanethiol dioxygenase-like [Fragaria vesca subsp. vesca]